MDKNNIDDILKSISEEDLNDLVNYIFRDNKSKINTAKHGFNNLGSTCYMNAMLQCMINIPALTTYFLSGFWRADTEKLAEPSDDKATNFAKAFGDLAEQYHKTKGNSSIPPSDFKNKFGAYNPMGAGSGQQDSSEALNALLNAISESNSNYYNPTVPDNIKGNEIYKWHDNVFSGMLKCPFERLFLYSLLSNVKCPDCQYESPSFENTIDSYKTSIPKTENNAFNTIKECFDKTSEKEIFTEGNEYTCDSCGKKVLAEKQITLYDLPNYFIVAPNRFKRDDYGNSTKIESAIDFDLDNFSLDDYVSNPEVKNKNIKYELTGVVCHYGGTGGGHYTAYCKKGDKWFCFNDSFVNEVSEQTVKNLKTAGYVFFYRRKDIDYAKIFEGYDLKVLIKSLVDNGLLEKEYIINWLKRDELIEEKKKNNQAKKIQSAYKNHREHIKKIKTETEEEIKNLAKQKLSFRFDENSKELIIELGDVNVSKRGLKNKKRKLKYINGKETNEDEEININTDELKSVKEKVVSGAEKIFSNLLAQTLAVSETTKKSAENLANLEANDLSEMFKLDNLKDLIADPQKFIEVISNIVSKLTTDGSKILTETNISKLADSDKNSLIESIKNISVDYNSETKKLEFGIPLGASSALSVGSGIFTAFTGSAIAPALAASAGVVAVVLAIILIVRHYKRQSKSNDTLNNILKTFFGDVDSKDTKNNINIPKGISDFLDNIKNASQTQR